jgi:hypothetical protein
VPAAKCAGMCGERASAILVRASCATRTPSEDGRACRGHGAEGSLHEDDVPLYAIFIIVIFSVALLLGIGLSATAQPPPPRRPTVSRPVPHPTVPRALPPLA